MAEQGRVVLIVGPSCAGKSTLTKALQAASPTAFVSVSLDGLFASVPDRWGGQGALASEGFRYEWLSGAEGQSGAIRRIGYGDTGWRMLRGMHCAAAAQTRFGVDVVVDDMLLDEAVLADWRDALADAPTLLVRLTAPLAELQRREDARTIHRTPGLVAGHFDPHERLPADVLIDTSLVTAEQAAWQVLQAGFPAAGVGALHACVPGASAAP
jgi:chloramphenicol 3-O phosphotransferase